MRFSSNRSAALDEQARDTVLTHAADYLLGRQSPSGGFCFCRTFGIEEPNLFDTYHAVAALDRLGCAVPRQAALLGFLRAFASHEQLSALYYRAFTLQRLGRADLVEADAVHRVILQSPPVQRVPLAAALRRLRQGVWLKRHFGGSVDIDILVTRVRALQRDGGFGDKPNLEDTAAALSVLAELDALDHRTAASAREFVNARQVAGFGFTLTRDSLTPSLNTIRAGIEACDLLGLPVCFGPDIERFVRVCQTADGGFARVPQALCEIESTHHAVWILQRLLGFVSVQTVRRDTQALPGPGHAR